MVGTAKAGRATRLWIMVGAVLLLGLTFRLLEISAPPFERHAFRQTQTLSTIENFHAQGIDLLHPKTLYMGDPGMFVLELPLFQALAALLYDVFGPHLEIIRLLNILFGAATLLVLFKFADFFLDRITAILAVLIYWLSPLNIAYQRSMLLDPMAVFCAWAVFYSLARLLFQSDFKPATGESRADGLRFAVFAIGTVLIAMIKAIYLWPSLLLLVIVLIRRKFKPDTRLMLALVIYVVAGICFLVWNHHATRANNTSPFARGITPVAHLGFSRMLTFDYFCQLAPRPKWWLGGFGTLLYPIGLWAAWAERRDRARVLPLWFVILTPPAYLIFFANINRPHDYYQLIIAPFLAIVPANGIRWLIARMAAAGKTRPVLNWRTLVFGALLIVAGWSGAWALWHDPAHPFKFAMLLLAVPFYVLLFAAILTPTQHAALRSALLGGAGGCLLLASVLILLVCHQQSQPNTCVLKFQRLCAGNVVTGKTAMIFVTPEVSGSSLHYMLPDYIYASGLWGYGKCVVDATDARPTFDELEPAFHKLEYVLFYGTQFPDWMPEGRFHLAVRDDTDRLYIFQRNTD